MSFAVLFSPVPLLPSDPETDKDLKGFNEKIKKEEQVRRAIERGKVYVQDESFDNARSELNSALKLDQNNAEARFLLGIVERKTGNYNLALVHFKEAYEIFPEYKNLCLEYTLTYLAIGDCSKAEIWFKRHKERKTSRRKEIWKIEREIKKCFSRKEK